jgi:hypothetical protein
VEASVIADLCCMPEQKPIPSLTIANPSNSWTIQSIRYVRPP